MPRIIVEWSRSTGPPICQPENRPEHLVQERSSLHDGERGAQAEVFAEPEGEVRVGVTIQIQFLGRGTKDPVVAGWRLRSVALRLLGLALRSGRLGDAGWLCAADDEDGDR